MHIVTSRTMDMPTVYRLSDHHRIEGLSEDTVRSVDCHGRHILIERTLAEAWARAGLPLQVGPVTFDRLELVTGIACGAIFGFFLGIIVAGWPAS